MSPRIDLFDPATSTPHLTLLRLLHQCGTRPSAFAFADDALLTNLPGVPKAIEPLIQLRRDDRRVEALVVETVALEQRVPRLLAWRGDLLTVLAAVS